MGGNPRSSIERESRRPSLNPESMKILSSSQIILTFAFLSGSSASAATTLFFDDFESAPDPGNLFYGPGGALAASTWGMANDGPQNETAASSVNSYSNAANWNGPLPASTHLQLGFARNDATEVTVALDDVWLPTQDYRLSFDLAHRDNSVSTTMNLNANFFGVPLQEWAGSIYLGANQYAASFKADASDEDAGLISSVDLDALHSSFSSVRIEIVLTGAEVVAANQAGNHIYFSFDKGFNSEHHYIDNVILEAGTVGEFDPIPEPGAGLLFAAGAGAILVSCRRR